MYSRIRMSTYRYTCKWSYNNNVSVVFPIIYVVGGSSDSSSSEKIFHKHFNTNKMHSEAAKTKRPHLKNIQFSLCFRACLVWSWEGMGLGWEGLEPYLEKKLKGVLGSAGLARSWLLIIWLQYSTPQIGVLERITQSRTTDLAVV